MNNKIINNILKYYRIKCKSNNKFFSFAEMFCICKKICENIKILHDNIINNYNYIYIYI